MAKDIVFSPKNINTLLIDRKPCALATLDGETGNGKIQGTVRLYKTPIGVLVKADFGSLPKSEDEKHYSVCFGGKHRPTTLPCTPSGSCQCLTTSFTVEDVLGKQVSLFSGDDKLPLAFGQLLSVDF